MTSTIRVDNFGPSAGGTTYSARGIAKAWVNFNGTGTIAARDSENVSSLTDNGEGDYTVNFTNVFSAGDYSFSGNVNNPSNLSARHVLSASGSDVLAGSLRFSAFFTGDGTRADAGTATTSMHGDLA